MDNPSFRYNTTIEEIENKFIKVCNQSGDDFVCNKIYHVFFIKNMSLIEETYARLNYLNKTFIQKILFPQSRGLFDVINRFVDPSDHLDKSQKDAVTTVLSDATRSFL